MMKNIFKNEEGFTLLEVLIASVILLIGILAIGIMHLASIQGNASARDLSEASALSMDVLEQITEYSYDTDDFNNKIVSMTPDEARAEFGISDKFDVTLTVTDEPNGTEDTKEINVAVEWVDTIMEKEYGDTEKAKRHVEYSHIVPMIDR